MEGIEQNNLRQQKLKINQEDTSWERSMKKRVWGSHPQFPTLSSCGRNEPPTIFRVPDNIRACDPEAYEPLVVALGPFRNETYRCPCSIDVMQKHKWRCVLSLLSRHKDRHMACVKLTECLEAVKALELCARRRYMGDATLEALSSDEFAEILLLDSCFILNILLKYSDKNECQVIVENRDNIVLPVKNGIIHTSNLEFDEHCQEEDDRETEEKKQQQYNELEENVMLLEYHEDVEMLFIGGLWTWSFVKYDLLKLENQIPFFVIQTIFNLIKTPMDACTDLVQLALNFFQGLHPQRTGTSICISSQHVHHLLHLYHLSLLPSATCRTPSNLPVREWIPSATELQESGINFRRKLDAYSCLDVTFAKGVIEIPMLHLCKYSSTTFRNLMAFEQCFPVPPYVTNYTLFMDCILHSGATDMRLLHFKGIILNRQSSDEAASKFFNNLSKQIHYGYESNYLEDVFEQVMKHTEIRWYRWRADLVRKYFSSPWVIISVIAAFFLLLLTIEQAFFSAVSYLYPPR